MFRFRELTFAGWDYFPTFKVPIDADIVVLSGPNGSGKTTFLDAVRQLLGAPKLSSKRRLQHYLRRPNQPALVRAVVTNRADERGRRPFERHRVLSDEVTLACALVPDGAQVEKRFAILPGRVEAPELQRRLLEGREFLGPDDYGRAMEQAGVSRSLMRILALEQGKTNELFNSSAQDLFRQVLTMRGDQQTLERYRQARKRFEDSAQELSHQAQALDRLHAQLQAKDREVRQLEAYEDLGKKIAALELQLHAVRLQHASTALRGEEQVQPDRRKLLASLEGAVREIEGNLAAFSGLMSELVAQIEAQKKHRLEVERARDEAVSRVAVLVRDEKERAELEKELARSETEPLSLDALLAEVQGGRQAAFEAQRRLDEMKAEAEASAARLKTLEAGLPAWPEPVAATLAALERAGISARLLAAQLEPKGAQTAQALESALGPLRFALVVDEKDEAAAAKVAASFRFPGPLVRSSALAPAGSKLLSVSGEAPRWLSAWEGSLVELSPNGRFRDGFGLWVRPPEGLWLGRSAREARIKEERERLAALQAELEQRRAALDEAEARASGLEKRLQAAEHRSQIASRFDALKEIPAQLKAAQEQERQARDAAGEAYQAELALVRRSAEVEQQHGSARDDLRLKRETAQGVAKEIEDREKRIDRLRGDALALKAGLPDELVVRALQGELRDTEVGLEADLGSQQQRLQEMGTPPPETVREEQRNLARNAEDALRHLQERQAEVDASRRELDGCRADYLDVIRAALHDYRQRARELARVAEVAMEMELPSLNNDDRSVDEAGIEVRVGFDGKEPLPLGDPSFSGGQQVIAGLVLLMAMAETDGEGFFMLDEPFAHLSLDRVDQVGRFLRQSKAQFVITAPTTLDRAQLDPASMVVVLRKKGKGFAEAPVPLVARA